MQPEVLILEVLATTNPFPTGSNKDTYTLVMGEFSMPHAVFLGLHLEASFIWVRMLKSGKVSVCM